MGLPNCADCPMGSRPSRVAVPPQQPAGAWNGLAIVGEQPAKNEARDGVPFVGKSGHLLDVTLRNVGIVREHCFITNAFHCFHEAFTEMDDNSKAKAAECCRPRLVNELQYMNPRYILGLGGMALKSLTNNWNKKKDEPPGWVASITDLRGSVLRSTLGDLVAEDIPGQVLASFHPASILRGGGQEYDVFFDDVTKMARWVNGGGPVPWHDSYELAPSAERLAGFLAELKKTTGGAAVDIECVQGIGEEHFNRWLDRIRMIGIGWEQHAHVIPMLDGEWQQYYSPEEMQRVTAVLRQYLGDRDFFTLYHNLQYDIPVLGRHGLPVEGTVHDTMAAHYTLFHMGVRHGLGHVAQQYLDVPPWKELHGHNHVESTVDEEAVYNSRDIRTTAMVFSRIMPLISYESLLLTYHMSVRNHQLAWQMSQDGFHVDPDEYRFALNTWADHRAEDKVRVLEVAGVGERQMALLERVNQLKIRELRTVKTASFQEGLVTPEDVFALRDVLGEAKRQVVQKKAIREIDESENKLIEVLQTPGFSLASEEMFRISRVSASVKQKKQAKEDVELKELNALPDDVRKSFSGALRLRAREFLADKRKDIERLQELRASGVELKKADQKKLDAIRKQEEILEDPLGDPNNLKNIKTADWSEVEKPRKAIVTPVISKARTAATRLVRYSNRIPFVNFNADYEAGQVIHHWEGLPVQAPLTSKGEYAVDKVALQHVVGHPLVKAYQTAKLSHDRWDWLQKLPIYPDGRVHPVYKPTLKTGRWASGDSGNEAHPLETLNAQNMEDIMMCIFRAPPGMKYVGADFSGVELRVGGVLTGCTNLMEQFQRYDAGLDLKVHAQTARRIWKDWAHLPLDEQKEYYQKGKRYKLAKSGGFLTFYAGGPDALAAKILEMEPYEPDPKIRAERKAEIEEEAREFMNELKNVWPQVFDVREEWYRQALRDGQLKIGYLTGRQLRFPLRDEDHISATLCANAPVQCTAGEIAHYAFDKLVRALPYGARVVLYIHDCLIVECPEWMAETVRQIMKDCLEFWIEGPAGGLLCRADPKIGNSLHEVH